MALPKSMFHRIHLIEGTTGALYDEEEEQFVIDNNDVTHHGTAELLLDEQGKKIRFNKFNKDFDVLAESQDVFVKHLQASKSYLAMLQTGLPEDLLKYLENPDQFQIVEASDCVKDSVESVAQSNKNSSNSHLPSRESQ